MSSRHGVSYRKRVEEVNMIYDFYSHRGLPNREIWRRYIYPRYGICERTFYSLLKSAESSCLSEEERKFFKKDE